MAGTGMKFGIPPWLKRTKDAPVQALVKYSPPPILPEAASGWTPEALAEYRAEADVRAMAFIKASMEGRFRPRPRWANSRYDPLHWRG
jgi:hypothetical protein